MASQSKYDRTGLHLNSTFKQEAGMQNIVLQQQQSLNGGDISH